jgi:hypothetical protein
VGAEGHHFETPAATFGTHSIIDLFLLPALRELDSIPELLQTDQWVEMRLSSTLEMRSNWIDFPLMSMNTAVTKAFR